MDFGSIINDITTMLMGFAESNPFIVIAVILILSYLIYRKPAFFFFVFIIGVLLTVVLYLVMSMSVSGVSKKEELIKKGTVPENSFSVSGKSF